MSPVHTESKGDFSTFLWPKRKLTNSDKTVSDYVVIPHMFLRDIRNKRSASGFGAWTNVYSSNDLPPDCHRLSRVMSLEMFQKQVAHGVNFTRVDTFFDEFEATIPRFSRMPRGYEYVWTDLRKLTSVSCWTLTEVENDLFAIVDRNGGNRREIGIETTIAALCSALDWPSRAQLDTNIEGWRSPVLYMGEDFGDIVDQHLVSRALFWKSERWSGENEYRFVFTKYRDYIRRLHHEKRMRNLSTNAEDRFNPRWDYIRADFIRANMSYPSDRFLPRWHWMKADFSVYAKRIILRADAERTTRDFVLSVADQFGIPVTYLEPL